MDWDILLSIAIGIGLAAACGFRVFVPLLIMSVASHTGHLSLAGGFEWIASTPALIAFACATTLEIGAYYIPWIDNLLDTVSTPAAVIAGILVTASQVADMDPLFAWSVAIIAGGGAAGLVQGLTAVTRGISSMTTGGLANPILSTVEAGASVLTTVLVILIPAVTVFAILVLLFFAARRIFFRSASVAAA